MKKLISVNSNEEDNVVDINSELEEKKLQEEIDALNDQYQRLQAEYANYRRRTQQRERNCRYICE